MKGQPELYELLDKLKIPFDYREHPPVATIEEATKYWKGMNSGRCKNIFLRNHKGNRHYLVILEHMRVLNMRDLEQKLKQGKLSFASPERLKKYLGVEPGSVTPLGIINDPEHHVYIFIDSRLLEFERLSFHPNANTASITIGRDDLVRFIEFHGNGYEFIKLYEQ